MRAREETPPPGPLPRGGRGPGGGVCIRLLGLLAFGPLAAAADLAPPPRPAAAKADDGYEVVVFARHRPIRARVAVSFQGRPAGDRWAAALDRAFADFDRDGDGSLNEAETRLAFGDGALAGLMVTGTFAPDPDGRPTLAALDRDGDGRVSRAELATYYRRAAAQAVRPFPPVAENPANAQATEALFTLFDRDGDGKLTRAEVAAAERFLATRDDDEDECLSLDELLRSPGFGAAEAELRARRAARGEGPPPDTTGTVALYEPGRIPEAVTRQLLKQYDRDGDGRLTPAEIGFDSDTFARLDADRDGALSADELDGWRAGPPDLAVSLSLAPTGDECRAEVLTDPATLAARGLHVRRAENRRLVVRHGRQAVEFWAFAGTRTGSATLKGQFGGAFAEAAGAKGHVVAADLGSPQQQLLRVMFDPADRDGDGKLTRVEFDRFLDLQQAFVDLTLGVTPAVQTPTLFQLLDENRDGRLGARELRTAWDRLLVLEPPGPDGKAEVVTRAAIQPAVSIRLTRALDRSGPAQAAGVGSPSQVKVPTRGPVWFRKMDRNADGDVSRAEFLGTRAEFDSIDADHDGLISLSEAEAFDKLARPVQPAAER
ncbi:MAG: EF-hand domain-containing protein [Gemmataceae bacterium]|nr:EF-hand domain-containing protein [Gemmataceae bacterium]